MQLLILSSEIGGPGVKDELSETLEKFWSTESIGITIDGIGDESQADYREFLQEISYDGSRYSVKLPWKSCVEMLPDHYDLSSDVTRLAWWLTYIESIPDDK